MMDQLPPHVATADEPIEDLGQRPWDGPDMRQAIPVEEMLRTLHELRDDHAAYVDLWLAHVTSIGGWTSLTISRDGEEELRIGLPCDPQARHRNRWHYYLSADLRADPERRALLIRKLIARGHYADDRPTDRHATTAAIRDFLQADGRILIEPNGRLTEGAGMPRAFSHGSDDQATECVRASKAYFAVRRRWRSDAQIKRAVRMLGKRTDNGWMVLEARS